MTWLVYIVFTVCSPAGCAQHEFLGPMPRDACLAALADYNAGKAAARMINIDDGPDKGARYPIDGVWCLEPTE